VIPFGDVTVTEPPLIVEAELTDSITGTAIIYTALSAKCPSEFTVNVIVPDTALIVPSTRSIVANTGLVAALPVSTHNEYLFVEAVIVPVVALSVSSSTRLFTVSIVVTTPVSVTAAAPVASEAEMSE
jgi:hypothetical protein